MKLQEFLRRINGAPRTSVRAAMVRAISDLREGRPRSPRALSTASYPLFYRTVLRRLEPEKQRLARAMTPMDTYRRLAARVIYQALRDILAPNESAENRESARHFLTGSAMLHHWCDVGGLDVRRVICRVELITKSRRSVRGQRPRLRQLLDPSLEVRADG